MWRLSVVISVMAAVVGSAPTGDGNGLLQRLRRSPLVYCPLGPPGPPPPPPPPPSPFYHHHHQFRDYSEANSRAESGQLQRFTQDQGQNYQLQNYQGQRQIHQEQGQNHQGQGQACDTCEGQNSAISSAKSGTGNAVAIAVSKG